MTNVLGGWGEFPKIGLVVEGKKVFFSLREALPVWDSGFFRVEDSGELLESNFNVRKMTEEEKRAFQAKCDQYSASK